MLIRAKEGTPLEQKLRELHEECRLERERAVAYVQEVFGQKPIALPYAWVFGYCYIYDISRFFAFDYPLQGAPHIVSLGGNKYRLSKRHKVSREIIDKCNEEFRGIKPELEAFGIYTILNGRFCHWAVLKEKTGRFVFSAQDWSFTGESREQYEIILDSEIDWED